MKPKPNPHNLHFFPGTVMNTSHAPHISIGQLGHLGNAARCHVVVASNPDIGYAKMETNVRDAAWYVTHLSHNLSFLTFSLTPGCFYFVYFSVLKKPPHDVCMHKYTYYKPR